MTLMGICLTLLTTQRGMILGIWGELFDLETPEYEEAKKHFYDTVHFPFGLPNRVIKSGQKFKYPITMKVSSGTIQSFEIAGQRLAMSMFLSEGWTNIFTRIKREIPVRPGYAFAFDISRLHEGILAGEQEPAGSEIVRLSDERIEILNLIGTSTLAQHAAPPLVYVEMGHTWNNYQIPDRVYAQFHTMDRVHPNGVKAFTSYLYHRYNILAKSEGLDIRCNFDDSSAIFDFTAVQAVPTVEVPPMPTQPPSNAAQSNADEDTFPYDYYHSIGLIDDEGMVLVDSILGPVRTPARSEHGRVHLLEAGKRI